MIRFSMLFALSAMLGEAEGGAMNAQKVPTCAKSQTLAALACALLLAGCGTRAHVQVKVPVPIACQETVPERPVMPTEQLVTGVEPFVLLRAALAEIDRREGYEQVMRAALVACTAPIDHARARGRSHQRVV